MGSWSIGHWLIVLVIVALIFGTKKLRNMGEDLGSAVKSFRKGLQGDDKSSEPAQQLKADPEPEAASAVDKKSETTR